jgi:hypothetical protein
MFSRTLKALCVVAAVAMLSACGSSSTVDPFKPSRVIGLGDAYNDTDSTRVYTVRGTGTVETVVGQVAALFGVSSVNSYAVSGTGISDLSGQITQVGTFSASDLVVVTAGTKEIKAAYAAADPSAAARTAATALTAQLEELLRLGARHILVMQPLELSVTPLAVSNRVTYPLNTNSSPTVAFISQISGELGAIVSRGGYSTNPIIYGGTALSSDFNVYASNLTYLEFTTSTQTPACTAALTADVFVGCAVGAANASHATMLFADDTNLTPAGNRWVAQRLYNATAQGWR